MQVKNSELYVVKENDTLNSIAQNFNINPTSILILNNITPKIIRKGFVLYIPNNLTKK